MSRFETNPFAEEDVNPFSTLRKPKKTKNHESVQPGTSTISPLPPERYDRGATIDIPLDSRKDLKAKEKELQAREAELRKREQELKRREEAIARTGVVIEEKNWPPFFPIIHHDISNDIPIHLQKIQYTAFTTMLGLFACLFWNIIAATVAWIKGEGPSVWLLAIIYFLAGIPGAYYLWYRSLYNATRTDSSLKFGWFFVTYGIHIGFCVFATIAPPIIFEGNSLAGVLPAIEFLGHSKLAAIFYFIGAGLFGVESLLSIGVIQQVYMYFRGSGKAADMKRRAARQAMMAAI